MSSESKKKLDAGKLITSLVLLVLGIIFCLKMQTEVVSVIIGVAMCLWGIVNMVLIAKNGKSLVSAEGMLSSVVIAVGVVFISEKFLTVFIGLTPYILAVAGLAITIDAFIGKFARKNDNMLVFIVQLVVGVACIALGLCLLLIDGFKSYASIIFGVILIIAAVTEFVSTFVNK